MADLHMALQRLFMREGLATDCAHMPGHLPMGRHLMALEVIPNIESFSADVAGEAEYALVLVDVSLETGAVGQLEVAVRALVPPYCLLQG